jgi:hypothetical protein
VVLSTFYPCIKMEGLRKTIKTLHRITDFPAEIRTKHLPKISLPLCQRTRLKNKEKVTNIKNLNCNIQEELIFYSSMQALPILS